jgi:hypothetical protein
MPRKPPAAAIAAAKGEAPAKSKKSGALEIAPDFERFVLSIFPTTCQGGRERERARARANLVSLTSAASKGCHRIVILEDIAKVFTSRHIPHA